MSNQSLIQTFLVFLWKQKKLIIINFLLIFCIATFYSFWIVKKEYKAQVTFLPPVDESTTPMSLLGINMPSLSSTLILPEQIITIFNSKAIKRRIIEKFNFYEVFKLQKNINKFDFALRQIKEYLMIETEEKGSMGFDKTISYTITCFHPSPDSARMMCEFAFSLLDSAVQSISINRAHRNRIFVEEQLAINEKRLDSLQKVFEDFQRANKAFVIPEQLNIMLKTYAEIKSMVIYNELKMKSIQNDFNGNLPELESLQKTNRLYNQKLTSLEVDSTPSFLPSLNSSIKLYPQYTNLMRETEVQTQVILLLSKELQQARLQESKDVSSLTVVDPPFTPAYKGRPKRIPLLVFIVFFENSLLFLFFGYQFYFSMIFMKNERVRLFLQAFKK